MEGLPEDFLDLYSSFMREIKVRVGVIRNALDDYSKGFSMTGHRDSDVEICLLQLRKCLELMMFSSIIAHRQKGAELQKRFVEAEWNATVILKYLARAKPDYFPKALTKSRIPVDGAYPMIAVEGALSKEEFGKLYDRVCGRYLHASRDRTIVEDHSAIFKEISEWVEKLTKLLSSHWIRIDENTVLAVLMQTEQTGDVQVAVMGRVQDDSHK